MSGLPKGWEDTELDVLVQFAIGGDWGKAPDFDDPDYLSAKCIRGTELRNWSTEQGSSAADRRVKATSLEKRKLQDDDLIVEVSGGGPEQPVGRVARISPTVLSGFGDASVVCTNFFRRIVLGDAALSPYVERFLRFDYESGGTIAIQSGSNNIRNLNFNKYLEKVLPLPPLAEQKRILAKLDRLSARSGKAKEHLAAVQTLATRAKQATLAAVFAEYEGRELPLSDLVERDAPIRYGVLQPGDHCEDGVPLIRVRDLLGGVVAWNDLRRISSDVDQQYAKARVQDGDVLLSVVGTIGRVAIVSGMAEPTNIARAVSRLRPDTSKVMPSWLSFRLQAADVQKILNGGAREVARKTLNVSLIKQVSLTVPNLPEQNEIVRRIETAFAKIDRMVEEASRAADLLDRLDQQLLAKAFRGELVPQDPSDEPASVLLARIREARANAPKPKRRRKSAKR